MPKFKLSFYIWQDIVTSFLINVDKYGWLFIHLLQLKESSVSVRIDLMIKASESWFHGYHQAFWRKKYDPFTFHLSSVLTFYSANDHMNHS